MKKLPFLFALSTLIASPLALSADAKTVIKEAESAIKKAASVDGEWRDSKKFLAEARAALEAGDKKKALSLAEKAKAEGELGYEQATSQKKAGPWLF